ncbi:MAG: FtsK/SpoIIIE domain-containing protein, partial [Pirellulales bacterium]
MSIDESILDDEQAALPLPPADAPPLSRDRQVLVIHALRELAAARAETEIGIRADLAAGLAEADEQFEQSKQSLGQRVERDRRACEEEFTSARNTLHNRFESEHTAKQQEYDEALDVLLADFERQRVQGETTREEAGWEAKTVFDATKDAPGKQFAEFREQIDATLNELTENQDSVRKLLKKWRQHAAAEYVAQQDTPGYEQFDPRATLKQCADQAESLRQELVGLRSPALFQGLGVIWMFVFLTLVFCGVSLLLGKGPVGLAIAVAAAFVLGTLIALMMFSSAKSQVNELFPNYCQAIRDGAAAHGRCVQWAEILAATQRKELDDALQAKLKKAETARQEWMAEVERRRNAEQERIDALYPPQLMKLVDARDRELHELQAAHTRRAAEIEECYRRDSQAANQAHRSRREELRQAHDDQWQALADAWMEGLAKIQADVRDTQQRSAKLFPEWKQLAGKPWESPTESPPALRIGQFELSLAQIPSAVPEDSSLKIVTPAGYVFPAVVPFPAGCSLVFKTRTAVGRSAAVQAMQAAMLRLLTAIPPSKCRFTIIDPLGLGENFAAFMHLADHDEALVTNRIWTDPRHIEQRLADISEHMENVIQKYLRNEFATIEDYNTHAGEIAEPFRFLVVADFPHNFSEAAAKRLASIAASGARCGVFTIVSVDVNENLPESFNLRDLERQGTTLFWKKDRFYLKDRALLEFPLTLDAPPAPAEFTDIVHAAGRRAKSASRVEVPFEFIAPPPGEVWASDSRKIVDVPLGRAGATRLQHMQLGLGTSQHALVAGKTGSGKSTLLHALITNAALRYSPDELEL